MVFNRLEKIILGFALIVVAALALFVFIVSFSVNRTQSSVNPIVDVHIDGRLIKAETVTSGSKMYLGLSKRDNLCPNCGMLFLFSDKQIRDFVMRDMRFPLDIVFIADGKIINIAPNLAPEVGPLMHYYVSAEPADTVLELNANYCKKYNIKAGDTVIY